MSKALAIFIGALLLAVLLLFSMTYTVRFHEVAVKTRFGQTDESSVKREPGVRFRFPLFADRVTKYDTRLQLAETPLTEVAIADGQSIVVRAFLMWKVDADNALQFSKSYPSNRPLEDAERALKGHLHTAVKASLGRYAFDDLIGPESRLPEAEAAILQQLSHLGSSGIEPVTVGVSQILLPPKTTTAVLKRMQATRNVLAETERFKGAAEGEGIRSEAKTIADKLRAFTGQRVEEIKAEASQRSTKYLKQMSAEPELAGFLAELKALQEVLREGTTFFLSDELSPWHLMNRQSQLEPGRIPQPKRGYIPALPPSEAAEEPIAGDQKAEAAQPAPAEEGS